jgi:prepilin-type N-terminal cleavage/methylation domain-containing protein
MKNRRGFTLVELLVAMALVVFIMVIVSETFVSALESVRLLKSQQEMQANLRIATMRMQSDLTAAHFGQVQPPSQEISQQANLAPGGGGASPVWGYFRIMQGSQPIPYNAASPAPFTNDSPNDPHPEFTATDQILACSCFNQKTRQWYEVAYFLQPNGATAGGTTLYALYRRENPLVGAQAQDGSANDWSVPFNRYGMQTPQNWKANAPANSFGATYPNPVVGASVALLNSVPGVTSMGMPTWKQAWQQQLGGGTGSPYVLNLDPFWIKNTAVTYDTTVPANYSPVGDDILLTNVLSFDIRVSFRTQPIATQPNPYEFLDLFAATKQVLADNSTAPPTLNDQFWDPTNAKTGANPAVFDTWCNWTTKLPTITPQMLTAALTLDPTMLNVPLPIQIVAVQITIRVWDERTQQAKQITIVQNV